MGREAIRIAMLMVLAFIPSCGGAASQKPTSENLPSPSPSVEASETFGLVSLIEVIGNPAKYSGKKIQVLGFLRLEAEAAIYLSRDDAKYHIIKNGVELKIAPTDSLGCKQMKDSFVAIEGTFYPSSKSHESYFSGGIENITMCRQWTKP